MYDDAGRTLHITVVGRGGHKAKDDGAMQRSILMCGLAKADLPFLSVVRNGYLSCHEHFLTGDIELEGHNEECCRVCIAKRQSQKGLFSSFFAKGAEIFENVSESIKTTISGQDQGRNALPIIRNMLFGEPVHPEDLCAESGDEENREQRKDGKRNEKEKPNDVPDDMNEEEKPSKNVDDVEYVLDIRARLGDIPKDLECPQLAQEYCGPHSLEQWTASGKYVVSCDFECENGEHQKRYVVLADDYLVSLASVEGTDSVQIASLHCYATLNAIVLKKLHPHLALFRFDDGKTRCEERYELVGVTKLVKNVRQAVDVFYEKKKVPQ